MRKPQSRRAFLIRSATLAIASWAPRISFADTISATAISPGLSAAAQNEGKVVWYTSVDLPVAEKIARRFEAKHPGIPVRVERNGSERLFQRIEQELTSGIHAADVVNTSDGAHFVIWKRAGRLQSYLPSEAAESLPREQIDPDGAFLSWRASLSVMGYNTNLVQ